MHLERSQGLYHRLTAGAAGLIYDRVDGQPVCVRLYLPGDVLASLKESDGLYQFTPATLEPANQAQYITSLSVQLARAAELAYIRSMPIQRQLPLLVELLSPIVEDGHLPLTHLTFGLIAGRHRETMTHALLKRSSDRLQRQRHQSIPVRELIHTVLKS